MALDIAGRNLDVDDCADWLVDSYNKLTIKYYDHGGESPTTEVTLADIGRLTVFAARLTYKQAGGFLARGSEDDAPWPTDTAELRLDFEPEMDPGTFAQTPQFQSASKIFSHLKGAGWPRAQTSKLLHLKWPAFFPIVDRECRQVYWEHAAVHHDLLFAKTDSRTPEGYWLAIRQDLLGNRQQLEQLKLAISQRATNPGPETAGHVDRLLSLKPLRLLDMVVWGLGRGDLEGRQL